MSRRITYAEKRTLENELFDNTSADEFDPTVRHWHPGWTADRLARESTVPEINRGHVDRLAESLKLTLQQEPDLKVGHIRRLEALEQRIEKLEAANVRS